MLLALAPGEQAQVDWGECKVIQTGRQRKVQLFCMRLSFSKASFVWPYERATLEAFLDGHVRAFDFFGNPTLPGTLPAHIRKNQIFYQFAPSLRMVSRTEPMVVILMPKFSPTFTAEPWPMRLLFTCSSSSSSADLVNFPQWCPALRHASLRPRSRRCAGAQLAEQSRALQRTIRRAKFRRASGERFFFSGSQWWRGKSAGQAAVKIAGGNSIEISWWNWPAAATAACMEDCAEALPSSVGIDEDAGSLRLAENSATVPSRDAPEAGGSIEPSTWLRR